jgi:hypothetical protein
MLSESAAFASDAQLSGMASGSSFVSVGALGVGGVTPGAVVAGGVVDGVSPGGVTGALVAGGEDPDDAGGVSPGGAASATDDDSKIARTDERIRSRSAADVPRGLPARHRSTCAKATWLAAKAVATACPYIGDGSCRPTPPRKTWGSSQLTA